MVILERANEIKLCSWKEWLWWLSGGRQRQEQLQWMGQPRRSTARNKKIHCNESKSLLIIHWASSESKLSSFNQTTYVVIPCMVFVEDDGGSKTPCRVNASSSYGDGSQMNQEDCESNGKGSQNLQKNHELHNESMPLIQNTLIVFLISQINLQQLQEYIYIYVMLLETLMCKPS